MRGVAFVVSAMVCAHFEILADYDHEVLIFTSAQYLLLIGLTRLGIR
jgi:hypothetical protein